MAAITSQENDIVLKLYCQVVHPGWQKTMTIEQDLEMLNDEEKMDVTDESDGELTILFSRLWMAVTLTSVTWRK